MAHAADVHEHYSRRVPDEVIVKSGHLEAVVEGRAHYRAYLVLTKTKSPMTMSLFFAHLNPAHEVRPIGGDIVTPPMTTARSVRGTDTLNTPSFSSSAPLAPLSRSIAPVSSAVRVAAPKAR